MSSPHHQLAVEPPPPADPGVTADGGPGRPRRRRVWPAVAVAAAVAASFVAGFLLSDGGGGGGRGAEDPQRSAPPVTWLSGATGEHVATGEFGEWRGRPVDMMVTFVDDNERMVELPQLQPGEELGDWDKPLDIAVGAFGEDESWEDAADGDYDDRWRESLTALAEAWEGREGTVYIRFAHEMNGSWYPWSVSEGETDEFIEAWQRYRALQQEIFPESQLVFCVNRRSSDENFDWREAFPGAEHVDVMAVDYYNQSPHVETVEEWERSVVEVDDTGAPVGLQRHLEFAEEVGLPLAVPEWSGNADMGDAPVYIEQMHAFFSEHGGTGAGELLYESVFNRERDDQKWLLYGDDVRLEESAEVYRELF